MTLTTQHVFLATFFTVLGAVIQFYTDNLPIGTVAIAIGVAWCFFGLSKLQTGYLVLPFTQLDQATEPTQLTSINIPLYTKQTSAAFLVMMAFMLPSLWLGVHLLLKAVIEWDWFWLFLSFLVLGFSWLSGLAMLSEMYKDTRPIQHGALTLTPQSFHIDFKGQNYHLNWYGLRDIVADDGEGTHKKIILVMSIGGNLRELIIHQYECDVETRKLTTFLQHYCIKAQGRQVPVIR